MADSKDCPHIGTCEMFKIFSYSGTLATWQHRYCTADYTVCVRYQAAARGQKIPPNLMPNGHLLNKVGNARR